MRPPHTALLARHTIGPQRPWGTRLGVVPAGAENAFKARESGPQDDEIARLTEIAGKTALENKLLRKKIGKFEKGVPFHLRK